MLYMRLPSVMGIKMCIRDSYKEEHSKLYYLKYYVADDDMSGETGAEGEVVHRDASGKRYACLLYTSRCV